MVIPSVTILNGDGVDAAAAVARQGSAQEIIAAAEKAVASGSSSNVSFISNISASGQARLSLESFQARAEALQAVNVPPTVNDFKVAVHGIVSAFDALRTTLANAVADGGARSRIIENAREFVDRIAAGNKDQDMVSLAKKIGIERQGDSGFGINQKQLVKAFNEDGKGAFSALSEFVARLAEAKDVSSSSKKADNEKSRDAARSREIRQVQQTDVQAPDFSTQTGAQSISVSGFTAQTAVTSYLTVASL